jgi:hypothetical protein
VGQYKKLLRIKKGDKVQSSIMGACEWFGQLSESGTKRECFVGCSKIVDLPEGLDQSGNSKRESDRATTERLLLAVGARRFGISEEWTLNPY